MRVTGLKQVAGRQGRRRSAGFLMVGFVASLAVCGCGNTYRPVVSAISPVGPAGQPTKYAVAVSNTTPYGSAPTPGLLTFVDFSGDTILSTPSILPFPAPTTPGTATVAPAPTYVNPNYFTINSSGSEGFVVNASGTFNLFGLSNPPGLLTQDVVQTTLASNSVPNGIQTFSLPSTGTTVFVPQPDLAQIAELELSTGPSLLQNLSVTNPAYVVGTDNAQRVYAISQGASTTAAGQVYPINNSPVSLESPITVGANPVYGIMTTDGNRAFILNQDSGTVSVINVPSNTLDAGAPTITLPNISSGGLTIGPNPVWADLDTVNAEIVVLNQGDGVHPGSLSIISIPLCNTNTPVTNPNCNAANPIDAVGFGTIVATVPVGINPTMVSVLADGSRAYVANSGILPTGTSAGVEGSVSVVNLINNQVTTIPAISSPAVTLTVSGTGSTPTSVYGHPNTIAATTGTPTGKVYVTSTDNKYLTVIETDTDTVDTHISLQGLGVRVLVTAK